MTGCVDDLDPRWDWVELRRYGSLAPTYVRGRCLHTEVAPVESVVDGTILAQLCLTCDSQLPKGWKP